MGEGAYTGSRHLSGVTLYLNRLSFHVLFHIARFIEVAGAIKRVLKTLADVFPTDLMGEIGAEHQAFGLLARSAQDQVTAPAGIPL